MRQLFDDPLFQMFAERATMMMTRGGAEYGECAATARCITSGDADSWYREWGETAERVVGWGDESASRGHAVSAREAYLRASTYYRISFYPLFGAPVDPRLVAAFDRETQCFGQFAALQECTETDFSYNLVNQPRIAGGTTRGGTRRRTAAGDHDANDQW